MTASTSKKVLIQRFDREPLQGFVNPQTCQQPGGIELLTVTGNLSVIPYEEIKIVYFVRDFDATLPALERRAFQTRPKTTGIWVRLQFRDGDYLEGIHPNNLLQFEPHGFTVTPPDSAGVLQRVFVPRAALTGIQVLGVVGSPFRKRRKAKPAEERQLEMFE